MTVVVVDTARLWRCTACGSAHWHDVGFPVADDVHIDRRCRDNGGSFVAEDLVRVEIDWAAETGCFPQLR